MTANQNNSSIKYKLRKFAQHVGIFFEFIPPTLGHLLFYPLGKLIYRRRNIWLFSERGTDARDNGYHLYRFVREQHPEIDAHYVISRTSPDREKLLPLGNIVNYRSLKHRLMFYGAKYTVSSHVLNSAPNFRFHHFVRSRLHKDIVHSKVVFLQHGIIKDDMPCYYQENCGASLFICGAMAEYNFISQTFHYHHGEVRYTGLPRFDRLMDCTPKDQILIMPTWRSWLVHDLNSSAENIRNSEYVQRWNALLNNQTLHELAEKHHVQIVFYPHHEMQKHLHMFSTAGKDIVIADSRHYDVQQLLKDSKLLITDYSSVFFDFAYMHKPLLYYQFDEAQFFARHYQKGYFDYRRDGFGEVVTEEDDLLRLLAQYLDSGLLVKPEYAARVEAFFPLHDANNCQRVYEEILKLSAN